MARHGMLNNAIFRLTILGVLALLLVVPVMAQDEATEEPGEDKFAKIQASTDSLGFGSTAADSLREVPQIIEPVAGLMGMVDRSPLGKTGAGELFVKGGTFMWWLLTVALVGFIFIIERLWTLNRARVNTRRLIGTIITTLRNDGVQAASEECQKVRGPIAAILYAGLQKAEDGEPENGIFQHTVTSHCASLPFQKMGPLERLVPGCGTTRRWGSAGPRPVGPYTSQH